MAYKIQEIKNDKFQTAESKEIEIDRLKRMRPFPFCNADIRAHLRQERTIGILPHDDKTSSFLAFDIDVNDIEIVERVWKTVNIFGIKDEQILANWSGNKGYHITIFFNSLIKKSDIEKLFHIIIKASKLDMLKGENDADVVECVGISWRSIMLSLSLNRKSTCFEVRNGHELEQQKLGRGNFCYLINKRGREIDTLEKIESMQKVDLELLNQIIR